MSKNEEPCIKNEEFCIKTEEFCIKNDEFCRELSGTVPSTSDILAGTGDTIFVEWTSDSSVVADGFVATFSCPAAAPECTGCWTGTSGPCQRSNTTECAAYQADSWCAAAGMSASCCSIGYSECAGTAWNLNQRVQVTSGGSIMSVDNTHEASDPILGADGDLVFNWWYGTSGTRIASTAGQLSDAGVDDAGTHGLGNDFLVPGSTHENGAATSIGTAEFTHDASVVQGTCTPGSVDVGMHCGGNNLPGDRSLGDGSAYGWIPPVSPADCVSRCAADAMCSAFVFRHTDGGCFWKTATSTATLNSMVDHDCYTMAVCVVQGADHGSSLGSSVSHLGSYAVILQ